MLPLEDCRRSCLLVVEIAMELRDKPLIFILQAPKLHLSQVVRVLGVNDYLTRHLVSQLLVDLHAIGRRILLGLPTVARIVVLVG